MYTNNKKKRTPVGVRFLFLRWKDLQLVSVLQIGYNFGAVGKAAFAGIGENGAVFLKLPDKISSYEVIL